MSNYLLSQIEDRLIRMDPSSFQEMCDQMLPEIYPGCSYMERTGSQPGKRKTKIGTPDSFFLLRNGKYLVVEHTTTEPKNLLAKLQGDLQKAVGTFASGAVERVVLSFNSRLTNPEHSGLLQQYAADQGVELDIIGLDKWVWWIYNRFRFVGMQYLGLSIGSGQVISMSKFVSDYAGNGFQPGLHHVFQARQKEIVELQEIFKTSTLVFVTGKTGIGKSRLCIEAIKQFLTTNADWKCLCITQTATHQAIVEDLKTMLDPDANYLLFIDDANRQQLHLQEALEVMYQAQQGKICIVCTVRDYAVKSLLHEYKDFGPVVLKISPLSVEEIRGILKGPDYNIKNKIYQNRILKIAQENIRTAIMLADLAISKQDIEALDNVMQVYEALFDRIVRDCEVLKNPTTMKVLGVLAFFYAIDITSNDNFQKLLNVFSIQETDFSRCAFELEELELLDISDDRTIFKFSDQSLATYIFFKTFIKESLLPFEDLIKTYVIPFKNKVKGHVISCIDIFGHENVRNKILPVLRKVWLDWRHESDKIALLEVFWFYMQDDCLSWAKDQIDNLPIAEGSPRFSFDNTAIHRRQYQVLDMLAPLLFVENMAATVTQLGFEYVEKKPESFSFWINCLRNKVAVSWEDEHLEFQRQQIIFKNLVKGVDKKRAVYRAAWNNLAGDFLKTSHRTSQSGIEKHTISITTYTLSNDTVVQRYRSNIWAFIEQDFEMSPEDVLNILEHYPSFDHTRGKKVLEIDLPFILKILKEKLNPGVFKHCFVVDGLVYRLRTYGIKNTELSDLHKRFKSEQLNLFHILDRNRFRKREVSDSARFSFEEYEQRKKEEITGLLQFHNLEEFEHFYASYLDVWSVVNKDRGHHIDISFDQILEINFKRDYALGFLMLDTVLKEGNTSEFILRNLINTITTMDTTVINSFYDLLIKKSFKMKTYWLDEFFVRIPEKQITEMYYLAMLENIRNTGPIMLDVAYLEKYKAWNLNIVRDVLQILVEKYGSNSIKFYLKYNFFTNHLHHFSREDFSLLRKIYFIQMQIGDGFDHDKEDWLILAKVDPEFVFAYFTHDKLKSISRFADNHSGLGAIWALTTAEGILEKVILATSVFDEFPIRPYKHPANELFSRIPVSSKDRAFVFLKAMIGKYAERLPVVQTLFNIVRCSFSKEDYRVLFLDFMQYNKRLGFFEKILWGNSASGHLLSSGNTIFSDRDISAWEQVKEFLNQIDDSISVIGHKRFVQEQIDWSNLRAVDERRSMFMQVDF
jgi:hypothetical protein